MVDQVAYRHLIQSTQNRRLANQLGGFLGEMNQKYATFRDLVLQDMMVNQIHRQGGSAEDIAVALANRMEGMLSRIIELDSIAPKRIRTPDGVMVWRCPDELVPIVDALG